MQAIVLAAGMGNRISDVSQGLPKSYLPLNGETLIARNIRLLKQNGIDDIVLVTGHMREKFIEDHGGEQVKIVFNPFYKTTNVLASFWCALPYLKDDAIYLHADTVFDEGVLSDLIKAEGELVMACDKKACAEEEMKYTSIDGKIDLINKTMEPKLAEGEFLGVCKIAASIYPKLSKLAEEILDREEFQSFFEVAVQELIDQKAIEATIHDVGDLPWCEIDFPEDYEQAKIALKGR